MSRGASASTWSRGLFDVARNRTDPARVGAQLRDFAAAMREQCDLANAVSSPALPLATRRDVIGRVAASAQFDPLTTAFLQTLAAHHALKLLPDIAAAYDARVLEHQGIVEAHVTTAVPLPDDRRSALSAALAHATGKDVRLTMAVDPAILGGVVAQVGSTVFDGSIATQLERLRARIGENG